MADRAAVVAALGRDVDSLGFRGRGPRGMLGEDVADMVAEIVMDRTVNRQAQPDGSPLAPLRPATVERKRRLGYPDTILVETGRMLAQAQLQGDADLSDPHEMRVVYGLDDEARQKAEWAHEGAPNRARRPFYEIGTDPADLAALDGVVAEGLDAQARERWGKGPGGAS